ncbi:MAG: hypothetical protein H0Z33_10440 [Bacillaceae bacterium]|nr:hypothetical protein [Bacillaceae bacterium]
MKRDQNQFPDMDIPEITEVNRPEIGETTPHPASPDDPQVGPEREAGREQER